MCVTQGRGFLETGHSQGDDAGRSDPGTLHLGVLKLKKGKKKLIVSGRHRNNQIQGTLLVVQWLRLGVPNVGSPGPTRTPIWPLKILHTVTKPWNSPVNK